MTDAATPEPTSHRRLFIVVAGVAPPLVARNAGVVRFASSAAGSKASDYDDEFAAWKAKEKPILLAATAKVPNGTYLIDGMATTKGLARQQKGCDAVAKSRKQLEAAAGRLPTVSGGGVLGTVSSDLSKAGDASERREKTVKAYLGAAAKTLAQVERDCRWNIGFNRSTIKSAKPYQKSMDYLLQPGDREPGGILCPGPNTCISSIKKKQEAYADLRLEYVALDRSTTRPFFGKKCEATSYRSACKIIAKSYDHVLAVERRTYEYIRTTKSTTNNPRIRAEFEKMDKARDRYTPEIRKAVLALDPALAKDKRVKKSPSWTDPFFRRMSQIMLSGLKDERAAIEKL